MLNAMRKGASSVFMMVLMGLLIASFAIWGIGDVFRQTNTSSLVKIDGGEITVQEFAREFEGEMQALKRRAGASFTAAQAVSLGMGQRVLQNLIARETFVQAAERIGLKIPDSRVADEIRNNDVFKNSLGQFDKANYEQLLVSARMTPAQFEASTRQDIARRDLLQTMATSIRTPDTLVQMLYTLRKENRIARLLTVPASKLPEPAAPTEAELNAFHKANAKLFMAPEYRKLSFLKILPEDVSGNISFTDEELKEQYQKRADEFSQPEQRDAEQIVFSSEADAKQWGARLKAGEDFLKVAKESAGFTEADAKLGKVTRKSLSTDIDPAAAAAVFALKIGEASAPVQSQFGWHIFRVLSATPAEEKPFDEIKPKLLAELKRERAVDEIVKFADKIDEQLASGSAFSDIAKNLNLKLEEIPEVDRQGLGVDGKPVANLPQIKDFMDTAFTSDAGAAPILKETGDGGYYAVAVTSITASALRPLDQIRDAVIANWKNRRQNDLAKAKATHIAAEIKTGVELTSFKAEANGEIHDDVAIPREDAQGTPGGISPEIRKVVLGLVPGKAGIVQAPNGDGYIIIELKQVIPGNAQANAADVAAMKNRVNQEFSNDILVEYQNSLNRKYGLEINRELLTKVTSEMAGQGDAR